MTIPLVRVSQVVPFVDALDDRGGPTEALLSRARLDRDLLATPYRLIARSQVWSFADQAARREGLPDLGFEAALRQGIAGLGIVGQQILRAPSLMESIRRLTVDVRRVSSHIDFRYTMRNRMGWLGRGDQGRGYLNAIAPEQYCLVLMLDLVRRAAGTEWSPQTLRAQHPLSESAVRLLGLENTEIRSGSGETSISIPPALLSLRMKEGAPGDFRTTCGGSASPQSSPDRAGTDGDETFTLIEGLRIALRPLLGRESLRIELGAELVGLSVRSLQRALAREGTTWSSLLDDLRFDLARDRLETTDMKLAEIGIEIGIPDPAHFTRAFRRWADLPPSAYRARGREHRI